MEIILAKGSQGTQVARVQKLLNLSPPSTFRPLTVDGIFGTKTEDRVKEFQRNCGLWVDGVVGTQTRKRLAFTPAEYAEIVSQTRGDVLSSTIAMQQLAIFDREIQLNATVLFPEAAAQVIGIAVLVALFLLVLAALWAMMPAKFREELGRWAYQKLEELRNSLNLTPPADLAKSWADAVEKMVGDCIDWLRAERKKCDEDPKTKADCAKRSMDIIIAERDIKSRLAYLILIANGPPREFQRALQRLLRGIGSLLNAYTEYGKCIKCDYIKFF